MYPIGAKLRIKTTEGDTIEGSLYSFDNPSRTIVIQEGVKDSIVPSEKKVSLRILNTHFISELTRVSDDLDSYILQDPQKVSLTKLRMREAQVLKKATKEAAYIGVGVSENAQCVFDELVKTLPCRWSDDTIIVFDDISIKNPYTIEDIISGKETHERELLRVKKVLSNILKHIQITKGE